MAFLNTNSNNSYEAVETKEDFDRKKKQAKKGDQISLLELGYCYYMGKGTQKDYDKAFICFLDAANKGNAEDQYMVGKFYESVKYHRSNGIVRSRWDSRKNGIKNMIKDRFRPDYEYDMNKAIHWYTLSAKQGFLDAQTHLAHIYWEKRNYAENFRWSCAAAEQGDIYSIKSVGYYYLFGKGGVKKNYNEAVKCFQKLFELGKELADVNRYLGICYEYGYGVEMNPEKAFSHYYDAVYKHGSVYTYFELAQCYERGFGVKQDVSMAISLYSHNYTNANSNYALGEIYYTGKGVEVNIPKAVKHIKSAALEGHIEASYKLGYFYYAGIGVEKNYGMAKLYLERAAENGHREAKELIKLCEKQNAAPSHSCYTSNAHKTNDDRCTDTVSLPDSSREGIFSSSQVEAHGAFLEKQLNGTLTTEERDYYDRHFV